MQAVEAKLAGPDAAIKSTSTTWPIKQPRKNAANHNQRGSKVFGPSQVKQGQAGQQREEDEEGNKSMKYNSSALETDTAGKRMFVFHLSTLAPNPLLSGLCVHACVQQMLTVPNLHNRMMLPVSQSSPLPWTVSSHGGPWIFLALSSEHKLLTQ